MRTAIWKSMLDSDMNARYWKYLVNRYSKKDKSIKIFLAVMTSSTVAGWGFWESQPDLWKTLSALSAIIAIVFPLLNYQKSIEQISALAGKWGELRMEYEDLWLLVKDHQQPQVLERTYKKYRKIESTLQEKEMRIPADKKLLKKCYGEVINTRALNRTKK